MFDNFFSRRTGNKPARGIGSADATGTTETAIDYSALVDCTTLTLTGAASIVQWKLPPGLTTLYGSEWGQATLPGLPGTLTTLYCDGGSLTSLPTLPASLGTLVCSGNPLTGIPNIPASLTYLDCTDCAWTAGQVNALLAQLVASGIGGGAVNCNGSNAAPTGAGVTAAATLVGRFWTLTTS